MATNREYYIALFSIHGLIRGEELELGRDADTGGQTKYVVELARALANHPHVERVDLFTRQVIDAKVDDSYSVPEESIAPNGYIIRVPCGPKRYLRKEVLWPYLDEFADQVLKHFKKIGKLPVLLHGHYADAGYVGSKLSHLLGLPFVFTGHSLGRVKLERLLEKGLSREKIVQQYNIDERIEAEENALESAHLVVASTSQEVEEQYKQYERYNPSTMTVIPPGCDLNRFYPPKRNFFRSPIPMMEELSRFLRQPHKPMILAISRADERKNITSLIHAYAQNSFLKEMTNLVIVAGNRDDIHSLDSGPRDVLNQILYLIDYYDLYGSVAYPKHHSTDDVPDLYRIASMTHGVFVNPALTEPFGLTLIEAAACGLPIVATNDGGPIEITRNCENGNLVDPLNADEIGESIEEILSNRQEWMKLSKNGLRGVKKHYSWESHVKNYLKRLQKLMKRKREKPFWVTSGKKLLKADRILVTDIDNTLVGDTEALDQLVDKINESPKTMGFGIATGRNIESVTKVLDKWNIPRPDFLITSVGSEIHYGHNLTKDNDWRKHIHYKWEPDRLREMIEDLPGINIQSEEDQREHKLSFFIDPSKAPKKREIIRLLRKNNVQVKVVFSHQQYLDFLPIRASKGLAIWYLSNKWGIPMKRILVAGDSGNDEEMLTSSALAVVVGNYSAELEPLRKRPGIFFAQGAFAHGIIEGIDHYNFLGEITQPEESPK